MESVRELVLFSLEKRRPQADLSVAYVYVEEAYKKAGERIFTRPCSDRTRGNGSNLKEEVFLQ